MCDGIRFTTEARARNAINHRLVRGFNLEPYECSECGGWHTREGKIEPEAEALHDLDEGARACFGKKAYSTERVALQVAARASERGRPIRAYGCPHCGFWHLTSKV